MGDCYMAVTHKDWEVRVQEFDLLKVILKAV